MKEKTKIIGSWGELIDFVHSINPYNDTIVLSGWTRELDEGRTIIRNLVFTTKSVDILRDKKRPVKKRKK